MKKRALNLVFLFLVMSLFGCYQSKTLDSYQITHLTIATPGPKNHSYSTAGALSQIFNKKSEFYKLKLAVDPSISQDESLENLSKGQVQFALLKSDKQHEAYKGLGKWKRKGAQPKLRAIFSLYDNPLTLVASSRARIAEFSDLKNKKIALGSKASASIQHVQNTLEALNFTKEDYRSFYFKEKDLSGKLQDEIVDAFFLLDSHPSKYFPSPDAYGRNQYKILSFDELELDKMVESYPFFTKLTLPKDFYPSLSNNSDIETLSIKTSLITSTETPNHIVYSLTKEIFENLNDLRSKSEVTLNLEVKELFKGLTIPLHPGALMYFKEKGLIDQIDRKLLPEGEKQEVTTVSKI